jgi:hypothetical protein
LLSTKNPAISISWPTSKITFTVKPWTIHRIEKVIKKSINFKIYKKAAERKISFNHNTKLVHIYMIMTMNTLTRPLNKNQTTTLINSNLTLKHRASNNYSENQSLIIWKISKSLRFLLKTLYNLIIFREESKNCYLFIIKQLIVHEI